MFGWFLSYELLQRRRQPESELQGVIQGTGILCSCNECGGREVNALNIIKTLLILMIPSTYFWLLV